MNRGKRLTALLLALTMCLSVLPANVLAVELGSEEEATEVVEPKDSGEPVEGEPIEVEEAQTTEEEETVQEPEKDESPSTMAATSGKCGKNLTWKLDSKGTLTISGTGEMYDYFAVASPWEPHIFKIKAIDIKEGVTKIGAGAFSAHNVKTLKIPNSVTSIGESAFSEFGGVKTVKLPSKLKEIGEFAFSDCYDLTNITIPNGVTNIPCYTFKGCYKLSSITISKNATYIDEGAFASCTSLKKIMLPEKLGGIGRYVFDGCENLIDIVIPSGVTSISAGAFGGCNRLNKVYFEGYAPFIAEKNYRDIGTFSGVTATVYYPENDPTWTSDKLKDYGGNITWKTWNPVFDAAVYQAESTLERDTGYEENSMFQGSPSKTLYDCGEKEGLTNATKAWKAVTKAADAMDKPSTLVDIPLEKKDMYTAIILSVFEAESKNSGKELVSEAQEVSGQLLEYLKMTMKTRHNIQLEKDNDLTKMTRDQQATLFLSTNEWLEKKNGRVGKVLNGLDITEKILKYVQKFSDWCDYMAAANTLVSMDCYAKEIMSQLYQKASNGDLKWALQDCVTIMQSNEKQLGDLMTAKLAEGIRLSVLQEEIDALWGNVKKLVEKSIPYAGLFLTVCKASYTVSADASNLLFNTDEISENFCKMSMLLDMEKILISVYEDTKKACKSDLSHDNAEMFNHVYRLIYNCYDVDCQYALNFVNAIDEAAISVIAHAFDGKKSKKREELKQQIDKIRFDTDEIYWICNNVWIENLMTDYPEEYPKYKNLLHYTLSDPTITLSAQKVTYTGKSLKPSVKVKCKGEVLKAGTDYSASYSKNKNVGTATVTVSGNGIYYGKVTKNFDIIPKGVSSVTVSNQKGKKLKVSWKKNSAVNGYEIQYALDKNYKKPKKATIKKVKETSKVISGLKKNKKYYVRVRTYQKASGKTYYSTWSKTKTVTIKK